jgi:hypothetical protein
MKVEAVEYGSQNHSIFMAVNANVHALIMYI